MIQQLSPPIPVITPKGKALAHFIIDYGCEYDLQWICFHDLTGECWTWKNPEIRAQKNITQGRDSISPFYDTDDFSFMQYEYNNKWINIKDEDPIDDKNYLVCWMNKDGKYSIPHKAYFIQEEGHFFSLENNNSHPIIADIYMEIPPFERKEELY